MTRKGAQMFEGAVSVGVNALLFIAKFWVGLATGSIALMADAWHTMSDSLTSIFVVIAAKLAAKKPDKEHPFGHGRWELIASVLMAFVLAMIGYEFLSGSIERFGNKEEVVFTQAALIITIVSIVIKVALAQFGFYLGKKYQNPVITADGWHSFSDALSSVVVLVGIIITLIAGNLWWMDSVLGVFCALAIFYAAWEILKEVITKILGEEAPEDFVTELKAEVNSLCDKDLDVHHVHLHNYVNHKELTMHIRLDKDMSIEQGHNIATLIENMVEEKFDTIATVHVEPLKPAV